ncbi:MAG: threonine synthase [SAR202 cluster bacterium]|jgi:threonine synthase|nr:MAG: threonine synthase [SAR202 cluster bacterium]MCH2670728.1 threonine synthase [Dehalococcoidia bacterium]
MGAGVLNTYPDLLPVTSATPIITMGEGDTPLVRSNRLGRELGCTELYFKLEGCNPTGSFKDRGMVMAIAKALEEGTKAIMCASTGNTSASAAAFGAYCDIPTFVLIPKGEVAMGKLAQAMIYGAKVIMINGNFDAALGMVREFTQRNDVTLVNSVNPHRIEGQKTAAFEIVDKLGGAPDMLFIPVGNAGNITAYWKGFREYQDLGRSQALPRMMGFQAEGAAPIVRGEPVARPQTIASAIRIGNPATWNGAIEARDGSGGVIDAVSDDEILEAYRLLANKEGIFCEPASAASFAGLMKMHRQGMDLSDKRIVCICTGNGLKDPDLAVSSSGGQTIEVPANIEALEAVTIGSES